MPITFRCTCGHAMVVLDADAGRTITCNKCFARIAVPRSATTAKRPREVAETKPTQASNQPSPRFSVVKVKQGLLRPREIGVPLIRGDGSFGLEVVGESNYQKALSRICGGRSAEGADHHCIALLIPENDNAYDSEAMRVDIDGRTVGYLAREDAADFRRLYRSGLFEEGMVAVKAWIRGGWRRGFLGRDRGHFGVRLDMDLDELLDSSRKRPGRRPRSQQMTTHRRPDSVLNRYSIGLMLLLVVGFLMTRSKEPRPDPDVPAAGIAVPRGDHLTLAQRRMLYREIMGVFRGAVAHVNLNANAEASAAERQAEGIRYVSEQLRELAARRAMSYEAVMSVKEEGEREGWPEQ